VLRINWPTRSSGLFAPLPASPSGNSAPLVNEREQQLQIGRDLLRAGFLEDFPDDFMRFHGAADAGAALAKRNPAHYRLTSGTVRCAGRFCACARPAPSARTYGLSRMNIHEYQAKALFEKFGVPVPKGAAAKSAAEFDAALASLPEGPTMVKSQIHAGGRGKGTFTDGYKGGVKFCETKADAKEIAGKMINNTLVTIQTGPAGRKVQTVYFTVASDIKKEYYLAVLLDRASSRPVIVASTEGGVEIEKVAHDTQRRSPRS